MKVFKKIVSIVMTGLIFGSGMVNAAKSSLLDIAEEVGLVGKGLTKEQFNFLPPELWDQIAPNISKLQEIRHKIFPIWYSSRFAREASEKFPFLIVKDDIFLGQIFKRIECEDDLYYKDFVNGILTKEQSIFLLLLDAFGRELVKKLQTQANGALVTKVGNKSVDMSDLQRIFASFHPVIQHGLIAYYEVEPTILSRILTLVRRHPWLAAAAGVGTVAVGRAVAYKWFKR